MHTFWAICPGRGNWKPGCLGKKRINCRLLGIDQISFSIGKTEQIIKWNQYTNATLLEIQPVSNWLQNCIPKKARASFSHTLSFCDFSVSHWCLAVALLFAFRTGDHWLALPLCFACKKVTISFSFNIKYMLCSSLFDLLCKPRQGPTVKSQTQKTFRTFLWGNFPIGFHF